MKLSRFEIGYNLIALSMAGRVFFTFGILLNPASDALLMTVNHIVAAINACHLKIS